MNELFRNSSSKRNNSYKYINGILNSDIWTESPHNLVQQNTTHKLQTWNKA